MKWWLVFSMLGLLLIPAIAQDDVPTYTVPLTIETINVEIIQSEPPQVTLQVWGYVENACDFPIESQQYQSGRDIYVSLYIVMPPNVRCVVQERIQHTITMTLNGTFEKGIVYIVDVNDAARLAFDTEQGVVPLTNIPRRDYPQIESVSATIVDTDPLHILFTIAGTLSDGCEVPLWLSQSVKNTNGKQHVVLELYRELDPSMDCPMVEQAFEETVLIASGLGTGDLFIEIDDVAHRATIPAAPTTGNLPLILLRRTPAFVESIILETTPDYPAEVRAHVNGIIGETCPEAVLLWQQTTYSQGILVDLYTLVEKEATCPLTFAPVTFDVTIPLEGAYNEGRYQVRINDMAQWFSVRTTAPIASPTPIVIPPPPPQTTRIYHLIEQVDAIVFESYPYQIQLHIVGQQPDGCMQPVTIEQRRNGNNVTVEIYREMPVDILCPMVLVPYEANIMLDGGFEIGHYRIRVNDYLLRIDL